MWSKRKILKVWCSKYSIDLTQFHCVLNTKLYGKNSLLIKTRPYVSPSVFIQLWPWMQSLIWIWGWPLGDAQERQIFHEIWFFVFIIFMNFFVSNIAKNFITINLQSHWNTKSTKQNVLCANDYLIIRQIEPWVYDKVESDLFWSYTNCIFVILTELQWKIYKCIVSLLFSWNVLLVGTVCKNTLLPAFNFNVMSKLESPPSSVCVWEINYCVCMIFLVFKIVNFYFEIGNFR